MQQPLPRRILHHECYCIYKPPQMPWQHKFCCNCQYCHYNECYCTTNTPATTTTTSATASQMHLQQLPLPRMLQPQSYLQQHHTQSANRSWPARASCVAVRGTVFKCVAMCCRALQCVAVRCSALQCVAVRCSVLQCVAVHCSALQCVAVRCSALHCVAVSRNKATSRYHLSRTPYSKVIVYSDIQTIELMICR